MTSKALGLTFCRAEEKDREALIRLMAKVLRDGDSLHADKYDLQKWMWKYYLLPHAAPQIYLCKEGAAILGYYHCPVYVAQLNGIKKKIAMVQDVGVSEAARGKGVFRKLAEYATEQLLKSDVNMIYTFPNGKSIHTFLKYNGYTKIETFSTFILPVKIENIIAAKINLLNIHRVIGVVSDFFYSSKVPSLRPDYKIELQKNLSPEMAQLFLEFNTQFKNSLLRDYDYLHWRYEEKPHGKPYFFSATKDGVMVAAAIISIEDLLGSKAAVVLDFACTSPIDFAQLMAHLRKNCSVYFKEKLGMFYTSTSNTNNELFLKSGFLKIPEKFNPRALHLLGKNVSENETEMLTATNWNFTLSDWDVL